MNSSVLGGSKVNWPLDSAKFPITPVELVATAISAPPGGPKEWQAKITELVEIG